MLSSNPALRLLQARANLRKTLPVSAVNPREQGCLNMHSLEGYLFGMHTSPMEISAKRWGPEVDKLLPDACYEDEESSEDILTLYEDMADALMKSQFFRIHTMQIPDEIFSPNNFTNPLWHWAFGLMCAHELVMREIERLPKKTRKHPSFVRITTHYALRMELVLLSITVKLPGYDIPAGLEIAGMEDPMPVFFNRVVEEMCEIAVISSRELEKIL